MVSEIEDDYDSILDEFKGHLETPRCEPLGQRTDNGFREITEQELLSLVRRTMNFQRKIEYSINVTQKLAPNIFNSERLRTIGSRLIGRLCDGKAVYETLLFDTATVFGTIHYNFNVSGVIPLLTTAHKDFLKEQNSASTLRNCYSAYYGFKLLKADLIELEEELRLISALTTYPIEKRTTLKNQLVVTDFEDVAVNLEEAESNLESEHFKDSVSRCRDAIEFFVALIREKETGEKTEKHFATDLGKIAKIGMFDEATQKLAQGVYSFLSLKGSHKYDSSKVTVYDAETSLKETYSLTEMLLKKLLDFKKSKEPKT